MLSLGVSSPCRPHDGPCVVAVASDTASRPFVTQDRLEPARHIRPTCTSGCSLVLGVRAPPCCQRRHRREPHAHGVRTSARTRAGGRDTSEPSGGSVSTDTASPHSTKGYPRWPRSVLPCPSPRLPARRPARV